jgi:magnesium chelatase family protein
MGRTTTYPSNFILLATANPCPCGYFGSNIKDCTCSTLQLQKYRNKISGPLLDRIEIHMEIVPVPFEDLSNKPLGESSETIRKRVIDARKIQENRYKNDDGIYCNAQMNSKLLRKYAVLDEASKNLIQNAMKKLNLSARAYDRILKLARTIADLDHKENIEMQHISEAISYRNLDKEGWAV